MPPGTCTPLLAAAHHDEAGDAGRQQLGHAGFEIAAAPLILLAWLGGFRPGASIDALPSISYDYDHDHSHMEPDMRTIKAGEFKAKCLALLDEVAASGETIEITKRGKVVARLGPARDTTELFGRGRHLIQIIDPNDDLTETLSESEIAAWYNLDSDEAEDLYGTPPVTSRPKSRKPQR